MGRKPHAAHDYLDFFTSIGNTRDLFGYIFRPVFGSIRQGRKMISKPGGSGSSKGNSGCFISWVLTIFWLTPGTGRATFVASLQPVRGFPWAIGAGKIV